PLWSSLSVHTALSTPEIYTLSLHDALPISYGHGLAERALASAADGGWLAPGAIAVIEERKGTAIALPAGFDALDQRAWGDTQALDRKSTRLNSSHQIISYAVFCLKKKTKKI